MATAVESPIVLENNPVVINNIIETPDKSEEIIKSHKVKDDTKIEETKAEVKENDVVQDVKEVKDEVKDDAKDEAKDDSTDDVKEDVKEDAKDETKTDEADKVVKITPTNRCVIVTGAELGVGYDVVRHLCQPIKGVACDVIMACSDMEKAGKQLDKIKKAFSNAAVPTIMEVMYHVFYICNLINM